MENFYLLNMIVKCDMAFIWLNQIVNHILIVFIQSVLISKSSYENDQLYRYLECGAKISEIINVEEISNLYSKLGFENFEYIYKNWLANLGYDLVVFYSEECDKNCYLSLSK